MQLEEFVAESLKQIVAGVMKAQEATRETNARINPPKNIHTRNPDAPKQKPPSSGRVEFDIAVTAGEEKGTKGGIGVLGGVVGLGAKGESSSTSTTVSRIKFGVRVELPWEADS